MIPRYDQLNELTRQRLINTVLGLFTLFDKSAITSATEVLEIDNKTFEVIIHERSKEYDIQIHCNGIVIYRRQYTNDLAYLLTLTTL